MVKQSSDDDGEQKQTLDLMAAIEFTLGACALACWTNPGTTTAAGVTAFEGADAGPVPTPLVAVTVNV